jgi:hypothetical protein
MLWHIEMPAPSIISEWISYTRIEAPTKMDTEIFSSSEEDALLVLHPVCGAYK